MTACPISHEVLSAYVDSELTAESANMIAGHLAECSRCSAEYHALLATVAALRSELTRYNAPDMLRARIRGAIATQPLPAAPPTPSGVRRRFPRHWRGAALTAAALACVGLGSGATAIALRQSRQSPELVEQVLASHVRSLMPDHLTDVRSSDQHNVKPWFNGRLDFSPAVPRLDSAGFALLGGRLDYIGGRPVASVVYSRRQHIINVFSWPSSVGDAPLTETATHGYNMLHWREGGVEQWVTSDLNAVELREFVSMLRKAER
jgi:anti-sigma factor RsiW